MNFILLALLAIIILYFLVAFLPTRICAICAAVSLTWLGFLAGYFMSWHHDLLLLGILMGGSVVGLMYKLEKYFFQKNFSNFWLVRILLIIFGFLTVYLFLNSEWEKLFFSLLLAVLSGFLSLFFIKFPKQKSQNRFKKSLKEKLDHCCD